MATETEVLANETEITNALNVFGLGNFVPGVLDEIEMNKRFKKSLEQDDRGETFPIEQLEKQFTENLKNGYYCK
ncbi:MAG: hypothetical protein LBC75_04175 [Fibromonadaceae bacterium]|nr:hypothetical protein [Fibromonadaceae bacterium]